MSERKRLDPVALKRSLTGGSKASIPIIIFVASASGDYVSGEENHVKI